MSKLILKRAQGSIMEIVFVLIFITIMIAIVFSLITSITSSQRDIESSEELSRITVQIARNIVSLPYVQCADSDAASEFCLDLGRVRASNAVISSDDNPLFTILGEAQVLTWQYNDSGNIYTVYNNTPDSIRIRRAKRFPVTLYDPISDSRSFGILEVRVYQ